MIIRQFFQPYYRPPTKKPKKKKTKNNKKSNEINNQSTKVDDKSTENNNKSTEVDDKSTENNNKSNEVDDKSTENNNKSNKIDDKSIKNDNKSNKIDDKSIKNDDKSIKNDNKSIKTDDKLKNLKDVKVNTEIPIQQTLTNKTPKLSLTGENMTIPVFNVNDRLDNHIKLKNKPKLNSIWSYHDFDVHQVFGHFSQGAGFINKERNDEERAKLKPWLKPVKPKKKYDRTHVIPFGYHGSESDPRLVVGWSSKHNQNELKEFEKKQKHRREDIYWFTEIKKEQYQAIWTYKIYSAKTLKQLDILTLTMHATFGWRR